MLLDLIITGFAIKPSLLIVKSTITVPCSYSRAMGSYVLEDFLKLLYSFSLFN